MKTVGCQTANSKCNPLTFTASMYSLLKFTLSLYLSLSLQPTHLANFNQVQSIQYSPLEEKERKGMLQLNVAGAPEVKHARTYLRISFHISVSISLFIYK